MISRHVPAIVAVGVMAAACGDYAIPLPNRYELVRVSAGEVLLAGPGRGVLVDVNIDRYAVSSHLVVGHVSAPARPPEARLPPGFTDQSRPGYFIVDTRSGDVKQGLDQPTWAAELKKLGVEHEPPLKPPSRLDRYF